MGGGGWRAALDDGGSFGEHGQQRWRLGLPRVGGCGGGRCGARGAGCGRRHGDGVGCGWAAGLCLSRPCWPGNGGAGGVRCTGDGLCYVRMVLPFSFARRRCRSGATLVVGLGGWLVLAGGAEVVLSGCAGLLPVQAVWKRRGAGYCHGHVVAAGMVLSRAKAFTDTFVGGNGGGALVASFSLLGAPL